MATVPEVQPKILQGVKGSKTGTITKKLGWKVQEITVCSLKFIE